MRVEGRDDARPPIVLRMLDGAADDRLVAGVEAVPIAERDDAAAQGVGDAIVAIAADHACPPFHPCLGRTGFAVGVISRRTGLPPAARSPPAGRGPRCLPLRRRFLPPVTQSRWNIRRDAGA